MLIPAPFDVESLVLSSGEPSTSSSQLPERNAEAGDAAAAHVLARLRAGEQVLDLGCGAGLSSLRAAQAVGPEGRVVGVDLRPQQLALAAVALAGSSGAPRAPVTFHRARVQDLRLDLDAVDAYLAERPARSVQDLRDLEGVIARLREQSPLIARESVDVILTNRTLNLVAPEERPAMFEELHRVLRRGGRLLVCELVSDEDVPARVRHDQRCWTLGAGGAFREDRLLEALEDAGFYGIRVEARSAAPQLVKEGVEFRLVVVAAYKGKEGPCFDRKHAVIYRGPFREVVDDDGHSLRRGMRVAVCEKTFRIYSRPPYAEHFDLVEPAVEVPLEKAPLFPCSEAALRRDPRETKGVAGAKAPSACAPGNGKGTGGACC